MINRLKGPSFTKKIANGPNTRVRYITISFMAREC